jgi:ABC-type transport system involved in multi-copper enzyme maturation permease subunit
MDKIWTVAWQEIKGFLTWRRILVLAVFFFIMLSIIKQAGVLAFLQFVGGNPLFDALSAMGSIVDVIFLLIIASLDLPSPLTLSVPYYMLTLILPLIIMITSHHIFSKEIEDRTTHFIIPNIPRIVYVVGKLMAHYLVYIVLLIIIMSLALVYTYTQVRIWHLDLWVMYTVGILLYTLSLLGIYSFLSVLAGNADKSNHWVLVFIFLIFITMAFVSLRAFNPLWYGYLLFTEPFMAYFFWLLVGMTTISASIGLFERKSL